MPVPKVALLVAVKVSVLEPVAGFGLKEAPTPPVRPEADSLTLGLKPLDGVMVMVLLPFAPCVIVKLLGEAESEKSGGEGGAVEFTVRPMVVVCVKLPAAVPVTVTVAVPVVAALLADSVRMLDPVVGLALNEAVTPLGKPEADSETLLWKPFSGVMVIVLWPLAPWVIVKLLGEAEREKSGWLGG